MKITLLNQGYNLEKSMTVGETLISFLDTKEFHSLTIISAFASKTAVEGLSTHITSSGVKDIKIIVGIDQEGTPKEALQTIASLGVTSRIFYQPESPIFHPKIYLLEGEKMIKLIIGSSNFTGTGLFSNIESSVLIEFEVHEEQGVKLVNDLKEYYKTLFDLSDVNLFPITDETIQKFIDLGIVPDKKVWKEKTKKISSTSDKQEEVGFIIPKRATAKLPKEFRKTGKKVIGEELIEETGVEIDSTMDISDLQLVWTSNPLTVRDLNIKEEGKTNPSGSMLFGKGKTKGIDQRHYFREVVFKDANWIRDTKERTKHMERAIVAFNIYTENTFRGKFMLKIKHDTKTDSPNYLQKNSTTAVSWGKAKQVITKREYLDKIAKLYVDPEKPNEFTLVIE